MEAQEIIDQVEEEIAKAKPVMEYYFGTLLTHQTIKPIYFMKK